jgi:sec-independent protein translocase protein TatC
MTLAEHLNELRSRLIVSTLAVGATTIVALFFYKEVWELLTEPYREAARTQGIEEARLMAPGTGEGFLTAIKACFIAGLVVAGPVVLRQMWGFVSAGLYANERRAVRVYFPISLGLFVLGLVSAWVLLIPFGMRFLISWNVELGIRSEFSVSSYLSTCLTMLFGMGFVFQLPLVMLFLTATDLVRRATWVRGWRIAVLSAFVVGMLLTDPSPITQVMMAVPIIGLYGVGIWGGRFVGPDAEPFRVWKAWPLVLGAVAFGLMLVYAEQINDFAAHLFGGQRKTPEGP